MSQQVLPPIERLCEPIEGTDRARLAECLGRVPCVGLTACATADHIPHAGLDPNRYRSAAAGESEARAFSTLDSLMSDSERFKDCDPFIVRCRSCQGQVAFAPISDRDVSA